MLTACVQELRLVGGYSLGSTASPPCIAPAAAAQHGRAGWNMFGCMYAAVTLGGRVIPSLHQRSAQYLLGERGHQCILRPNKCAAKALRRHCSAGSGSGPPLTGMLCM